MKKILGVILFLTLALSAFSQNIYGRPLQHNLFWEGNSISFSGTTIGDHRIPIAGYQSATSNKFALTSYALAGRTQEQIATDMPTNIIPYIKRGDLIIYWEGTNTLGHNVSAADAYQEILDYAAIVNSYGAYIIVGTCIARDAVGDDPAIMTNITAYNALIRNDVGHFAGVADVGGDPVFNDRADCSNTIYYNTDKIHPKTAGQDVVIPYFQAAITAFLAAHPN